MIEVEFPTADDLGPLGRLVAPGELLTLEKWEAGKVRAERLWINEQYLRADLRTEALRKRLKGALLSEAGDWVREDFRAWMIEAAKLALCGRYLHTVAAQLDQGNTQAISPPKSFKWQQLPAIQDVIERVLLATDNEILNGVVIRAK